MTNRTAETDSDLPAGVDLRAFLATARLRWWVVPATVAVGIGLLWVQESDLRTEPASYVVSRTYEARDPAAVLAAVGIDPASLRSVPDVNNQVLVLQGDAVRREIADATGNDAEVTVVRSRPSFTLVDTLESDGESSFVFRSSGAPTYTFRCQEPTIAECDAAVDAYAAKAAELRRDGLRGAVADLTAVLEAANAGSPDPAVGAKLAALRAVDARLDLPLVLVAEEEEAVGATVVGVRRPTYVFGAAAGLVVALLILLQLTVVDSRLRSVRQLVRIIGDEAFLGVVAAGGEGGRDDKGGEVAARRSAVSLHHAASRSNATRLRIIPLRAAPADPAALTRLAELSGLPTVVSTPYAEMSVSELTATADDVSDVLLVRRDRDLRGEVAAACAAMRRSGRAFGGVILAD